MQHFKLFRSQQQTCIQFDMNQLLNSIKKKPKTQIISNSLTKLNFVTIVHGVYTNKYNAQSMQPSHSVYLFFFT